eukprot:SAG31_NODE_18430_length_636_cov_2.512104_1_plen_86_part_00
MQVHPLRGTYRIYVYTARILFQPRSQILNTAAALNGIDYGGRWVVVSDLGTGDVIALADVVTPQSQFGPPGDTMSKRQRACKLKG